MSPEELRKLELELLAARDAMQYDPRKYPISAFVRGDIPFTGPGASEALARDVTRYGTESLGLFDMLASESLPGRVAQFFNPTETTLQGLAEQALQPGLVEQAYMDQGYEPTLFSEAISPSFAWLNADPFMLAGGASAVPDLARGGARVLNEALTPRSPMGISQKGMIGSKKGAKPGDLKQLARAEELESERGIKDIDGPLERELAYEEIWNETGWWLGDKDGIPRMEFDDSRMVLTEKGKDAIRNKQTIKGKLSELVEHPEYFERYPEMRDIDLTLAPGNALGGQYSPSRGEMMASMGAGSPEALEREIRRVLGHEMQHGVDTIEGMPRGGRMSNFRGELPQDVTARLEKAREDHMRWEFENLYSGDGALDAAQGARWQQMMDALDGLRARIYSDPEAWPLYKEVELQAAKILDARGGEDLVKSWFRANRAMVPKKSEFTRTPFDQYRALAGEQQANLTGARMDLTPDDRDLVPFWEKTGGPFGRQLEYDDMIYRDQDGRDMFAEVWHGSPYRFDRFRHGFMGSGEGAQAYGWGTYLADSKDVAKSYSPGGEYYHGRPDLNTDDWENAMSIVNNVPGLDVPEPRVGENGQEYIAEFLKKHGNKLDIDQREYLEGLAVKPLEGWLYKVDLPDDQIEKMLDWDAPFKDQPEFVQRALKSALAEGPYPYTPQPGDIGSDLYGALRFDDAAGQGKDASMLLNKHGIPGIKYFDGLSRDSGQGTRNYVVFDENLMTIKSRNGEPMDSASDFNPGQISTRFPTAVRAKEDPLGHDLIVGLESSRMEADKFKHNTGLLSGYENFQRRGARSPDAKAEQFIEHARENLNFLYGQYGPEFRERAMQWYDGANRIANESAQRFDVSPESAAGVYAALSPQKDWFMNVSLGDRVMDIWRNRADAPWDSALQAKLDELAPRIKNPAHQQFLESVKGKRLDQLEDPVERALWIRLYDETHNPRDYSIVTPEGDRSGTMLTGKGEPGKVAWGSLNEISSAVAVLDDPSLNNISRQMGTQHKVRNFYNNIIAPLSPRGDVTIDTHAIAADMLQPLAGGDEAVLHNFGSGVPGARGPANSALTGNKGTYGIHAEAYRRAAQDQGLLPRQMQSITWEAVRGLFNNKSAAQKNAAKAIWNDYKRGKISQQKAQELILEAAGGINDPAWAR